MQARIYHVYIISKYVIRALEASKCKWLHVLLYIFGERNVRLSTKGVLGAL